MQRKRIKIDYKLFKEIKTEEKDIWKNASKLIQEAGHWSDEADAALAFNGYLWSEITEQEFKEIYHDTYNDYFDVLEKLKMYGDSSIRSMVEDIDEKVIPNEMNFLIKKKGSRKSM